HDAAEPRVPEKTIGAPVAPHGDVAHRIDPKARLHPGREGEVETCLGRHFGKDRRQLLGKQLKAHLLRLAQFDHHVVAVRGSVLHLADRVGEPRCTRRTLMFGWIGHDPLPGQLWLSKSYHSRGWIARTAAPEPH